MRELWARARSCWTRILLHESMSVLVVAHNAVNQALLATAIGIIPFSVVDVPECLFEHTFLPFSYFEFFF